jgi:glycosyltransferase involved in cell wall biosynthesis
MKIYFDGVLFSWQKGGGVHRYFTEIINRLSNDKTVEVNLLIQEPNYNIDIENVKIKKFNCYIEWSDKTLKYLRKLFSIINKFRLNNYFKKINTGIFHSTYYTTYNNTRIPEVVTVHDMTHEKFPNFFNSLGSKRFIRNKKRCIEKSDAIICVSETTKKCLVKFYNVNEEKISVIYHGISDAYLKVTEQNKKAIKPYLLFVGNRDFYKNFTFLLNAFSKWNKNKAYDIVLTGNPLTKSEVEIIKKLSLSSQIKYSGFVSETQLQELYANSEAFIFPSLDEGFGLPILEAICCMTKVIASDIEIFREIGENMLNYFDPTDENSLIEVLERTSAEKINPEDLEKRANYVKNKFTWDKCANETIQIYKKLYEKNY